MELQSKRSHSALDACPEGLPMKRRVLNLTPSSVNISGRTNVPRSSFLLSKDSVSEQDNDTYDSDFAKRPAVHFKTVPKVDPTLIDAVSKYSDSEKEAPRDIGRTSTAASTDPQEGMDSSYLLERRRSLSRHPSFSSSSRKQTVPKSDSVAQERCFDYLLQSIDEVWARYCNTTATAEAKVYDNLSKPQRLFDTCAESRDDSFTRKSSTPVTPRHQRALSFASANNFSDEDSDDTSGYKSEITNPTEYETDCDYRKISNLPDSIRLQSLKDRLCRAKNDLEDLHDSNLLDDCVRFWRRWDMIKYSAVEMMEEDDDDDVIESVIEELERGRCIVN
ncbi:LAQU0S15e00298g1_1 [Lachancea quebecensis]|uniref:LAQU0S15e00298g1_1 n=1 Tax=Lachancea quebecensis TaxID=1654605 RepID=A0A0N7MM67_9SACH|nr:LAQU0S15e00298g1_1 [Lachancea quebecensis]